MAVTIIPFNLFHNHIEDNHVNHENIEIESNPCHISVYHKESLKNQCKHESHFSDSQETCEFCKYITSRRFQFTVEEHVTVVLDIFYEVPKITDCIFVSQHSNENTLGRAPPFI